MSKLERENADLNSKIKRLEKNLKEEKDKRNKLEQHGRLEQIEISGIPFKDDESCEDLVIKIAHLANCLFSQDGGLRMAAAARVPVVGEGFVDDVRKYSISRENDSFYVYHTLNS